MENSSDILILKGSEVLSLLMNRETELVRLIRLAYIAHAQGKSSLPYSSFLRFPEESKNRIIALPAYLGQDFNTVGVKWVASFPRNLEHGRDRASGVIILNSVQTGQPIAIIEGSIINAKRTAASAALAAQCLQCEKKTLPVGIIGCGLINFEIVRFLLVMCPEVKTLILFDLDRTRSEQFKEKCKEMSNGIQVTIEQDVSSVLRSTQLVSLATTASTPYISDLSECPPGSIILHVSLRDLSPQVILECDNVVDDVKHVCREHTSLHLAEQLAGNRNFIRCTLAEILLNSAPIRSNWNNTTVFSPFGLGILDIAVGKFVYDLALGEKLGTVIPSFLPVFGLEKGESQE